MVYISLRSTCSNVLYFTIRSTGSNGLHSSKVYLFKWSTFPIGLLVHGLGEGAISPLVISLRHINLALLGNIPNFFLSLLKAKTRRKTCKWASKYPEMRRSCAKYKLCRRNIPFRYIYKQLYPVAQIGPTCGIVALSMLTNSAASPYEIMKMSIEEGYTNYGEMLSCKNMAILAQKVLNLAGLRIVATLKTGGLFSDETVEKLLNGATLLVPYDTDDKRSYSPCLSEGHTAHWAVICGVLLIRHPGSSYTSDPANTYVFARHGKSRFVAAWRLDKLARSNENLKQCPPIGDVFYLVPEGGVGGENGLRSQFIIFEDF